MSVDTALVKVGSNGQIHAPQAETPQDAVALAKQAERLLHGTTMDDLPFAVATVATTVDVGFPEIKVDIPWGDASVPDVYHDCLRYYNLNATLRYCVDTFVDMLLDPFDHDADDDGAEIKKRTLKVYDAYRKRVTPKTILGRTGTQEGLPRLSLYDVAEQLLLDVALFGNAFPWKQWVIREIDGRSYDLPIITAMNPMNVRVDLQAFTAGKLRYVWRPATVPLGEERAIREKYGSYIEAGWTDAVFGKTEKELSLEQLTHLSYHRRGAQPYASPMIMPLIPAAAQTEKLQQMDYALADGSIHAMWVVSVGNDTYPALSKTHIDRAKQVFNDPRKTMFVVAPHLYAVDIIQPNVAGMGPEKYHHADTAMRTGLGIELSGDPTIDALFLMRRLERFRESVVGGYFQELYEEIAERNHLSQVPAILWPNIELQPDRESDDVAFQAGVMSARTYGARRRLNYPLELRRIASLPPPEPVQMPFSSPELGTKGKSDKEGGDAATKKAKKQSSSRKKKSTS